MSASNASLDDLEKHLVPSPSCGSGKQISHSSNSVSVSANHSADIRLSHLNLKDQFAPLLNLGDEHFVRCLNQLPDYKLEKALHVFLRCRRLLGVGGGFFARLENDARHGGARSGAFADPIIGTGQVQVIIEP